MEKTIKNAYMSTQEALKVENVSQKAMDSLKEFRAHLEKLGESASRLTHYQGLDAWSDPMFQFIHDALKAHGFVNGESDLNRNNPDASFWWCIYGIATGVIYSFHLKSHVSHHHSSAFERNEALKAEIDTILAVVETCQALLYIK